MKKIIIFLFLFVFTLPSFAQKSVNSREIFDQAIKDHKLDTYISAVYFDSVTDSSERFWLEDCAAGGKGAPCYVYFNKRFEIKEVGKENKKDALKIAYVILDEFKTYKKIKINRNDDEIQKTIAWVYNAALKQASEDRVYDFIAYYQLYKFIIENESEIRKYLYGSDGDAATSAQQASVLDKEVLKSEKFILLKKDIQSQQEFI